MAISRSSWTFPVPSSDALVVAPPDWEGFLLLNPTAAWVWQNSSQPELAKQYADHYGISLAQAECDLGQLLTAWHALVPPARCDLTASLRFASEPRAAMYEICGTKCLLRLANEEMANELAPRLAALRSSAVIPTHTVDLCEHSDGIAIFRDGVPLGIEPLVTGARAILLQELTRLAVPGRHFTAILHAGAVGNSERCVILAGASFSGKSTLCAALMQSGLICYSDDSAVLTPDYRIAGMPFAISLREGSWPLFPHLERPRFVPSNLNGTSPLARPVALVFVNYQATAQVTALESVDTFDTLLALQQSGIWVEHTQPAIGSFLEWLGALPTYRLTYSDMNTAMQQVKALLSA